MRRTNIHLTDRQLKCLKMLSEKTGLSSSEHIRRAVDAYIKAEGKRTGHAGADAGN